MEAQEAIKKEMAIHSPTKGFSWIDDLVLEDEKEEKDKVDHSNVDLIVENNNVNIETRGEENEDALALSLIHI